VTIYLDNAATTPVLPQAAAVMYEVLESDFGNPNSLYDLGLKAQQTLETSRSTVARAMSCSPSDLYFTSGATEANNIAVLGAARARKIWGRDIIVAGFEHPSVLNTVYALRDEGFTVTIVDPEKNGLVDIEKIVQKIKKDTALVACMHVNNETGAITNVTALSKRVKERNHRTAFHCDYVQGFLKYKLDVSGMDTVSVSAHKVGGPKGIGAMFMRKGFNIATVVHGGNQEKGVRSGTQNVAGAAGFAKAAELHGDTEHNFETVTGVNKALREKLAGMSGIAVNSPDDASPYILNFSVLGYKSETVLHFLEARGIYVSSGSACTRGARSHTLESMDIPEQNIDSAIRVSFESGNTVREVEHLYEALVEAQRSLVRV